MEAVPAQLQSGRRSQSRDSPLLVVDASIGMENRHRAPNISIPHPEMFAMGCMRREIGSSWRFGGM
jgi:hypothetical protein